MSRLESSVTGTAPGPASSALSVGSFSPMTATRMPPFTPILSIRLLVEGVALVTAIRWALSCCLAEAQEFVAGQVVVGVAELGLDHAGALIVVADGHLVGHAHAAVQLDGVLADELAGLADLHLGRRRGLGALGVVVELDGRHVGHRNR